MLLALGFLTFAMSFDTIGTTGHGKLLNRIKQELLRDNDDYKEKTPHGSFNWQNWRRKLPSETPNMFIDTTVKPLAPNATQDQTNTETIISKTPAQPKTLNIITKLTSKLITVAPSTFLNVSSSIQDTTATPMFRSRLEVTIPKRAAVSSSATTSKSTDTARVKRVSKSCFIRFNKKFSKRPEKENCIQTAFILANVNSTVEIFNKLTDDGKTCYEVMDFLGKNRQILKTLIEKKKKEINKAAEAEGALMRGRNVMLKPAQLDMAPARGNLIASKRLQGRLCDRSVLKPEGPKYNSDGKIYVPALNSSEVGLFVNTKHPKLVLPNCCNCCTKSVLGCT